MVYIWWSFKWAEGELSVILQNISVSARIQAILYCFSAAYLLSSSSDSQFVKQCLQIMSMHLHHILLQSYQECEKRGSHYLGGRSKKDATEQYSWSQTGRAAHTVIYMSSVLGTCTMESRAFGKERTGERRENISSSNHTHASLLLCLAVLIWIYLCSYQYLQPSSVNPHSLLPPPLKYSVEKYTQTSLYFKKILEQ